MVAFARENDLILISDLAYAEIYFEGEPPPSIFPGTNEVMPHFDFSRDGVLRSRGGVLRFEREFLDYLRRSHDGILSSIRETQKFEDDTASSLDDAYNSFLDQFETSDGNSIKPGNEPKAEALEDEDQEQIVKQKRG